MIVSAPGRDEAADFYFTYISKVTGGDVIASLESQIDETLPMLRGITEAQSLLRYEPGKWSIREVLSHMNDTERLFAFRAFWFARGMTDAQPSFDENVGARHSGADERPWSSHIEELELIRGTTLALFRNLPDDAWMRRGVASGKPVTVRALAYICAGHLTHHAQVIRERYLPALV